MLCLYLLGQNCLHLTFLLYFRSETYCLKYEKLPIIIIHCVETVKWLDYNRYYQLTRWCSGKASALGARGPGFNPRLRQGFLCLIFCFVVVFLLFCLKSHYLSQKFAIPFTMLNYWVYLKYCKICDRLYGDKDTDLASLINAINVGGTEVICVCVKNIYKYLVWQRLLHEPPFMTCR